MNGEPILAIRIDDRLEDYRSFFDAAWAERIQKLSSGTRLAEPAFTLSINWQAAANTCAMPWQMVRALREQWAGFLDRQEPFAARLAAALGDRLAEEMGPSLSHAKRKTLAERVRQIGREVQEYEEGAARFDLQNIWDALLRDGAFQLALWGSQRIGYGSICHAYEHFVRQCVALAKGKPDYGGRRIQTLIRDATACFGKRLAGECLAARSVRIARLVRNALAHSGGRETKQLRAVPHGLAVEHGIIQILAGDTRQLFDLLKWRAERLVVRAVVLPQMQL